MPLFARGATVTLTPPGALVGVAGTAAKVGPGRVVIYKINYAANVTSATTGVQIIVTEDNAGTTYLNRYFSTPVSPTGIAFQAEVDLTPGVLFDSRRDANATIAGVILISTVITGTGNTNDSVEVVYDFV